MPIKKDVTKKKPVAEFKPKIATKKVSMATNADGRTTDEAMVKKSSAHGLALVRGMKDVLPPESGPWYRAVRSFGDIANAYGFDYMETPIVELASLFIRSLGRGTDVVDKEMYVFEDRDGGKLCLRPEFTASVARAYIMHGLHTLPQPVKVWNFGPMFRYDRPQAGRYREFHQWDCESLGEKSPAVDAELIAVAYNFLRDLGIATIVHINSLGTPTDREQYLIELSGYLRGKRNLLCDDCKRRLTRNTLRVLDCKNESCQGVLTEAPQLVDWLTDESKNFFTQVLEYLDELNIPYELTHTLVRGLDYYTHTVFELYEESAPRQAQNALGGGGRYDLLIEQLGGQPTSAAGFALGAERIMQVVERQAKLADQAAEQAAQTASLPISVPEPKIFLAQLGEQAKRRVLAIIEELRRAGLFVYHNVAKSSLKAQMESANKLGVTHTVILGQKEVQDGTILIRNMDSGIQEIVDQKKLKAALLRILGKS